jgi:UMF1 family MFS transporter
MTTNEPRKPTAISTFSWIFYDLANTAFSMNVVTLYFPSWIIISLGQKDAVVSIANSISMILVAITMPFLGDWSDLKGKKLRLLMLFTATCIAGTAMLGIFGQNVSDLHLLIPSVMLIFMVANFSYQGGLVFYNALLPYVSTSKTLGRISGYGVAVGYLGSIVGLCVGSVFVEGQLFGMVIPGISPGGSLAAFVPTALLFMIFAVPIFIFVKEPVILDQKSRSWHLRDSYRKIRQTLRDTRKYPGLLRFLVARLFYEQGVETIIIFMAVYAQRVIGFTLAETSQFFIIVVPSAVVGSALWGILSDHFGPKKTLTGVILCWILCLILVILMSDRTVFWLMGFVVGALFGSTSTTSRPLLISLSPRGMLGEFFGLYALSDRLAAIIGPLIWSAVTFAFESYGILLKYKAAIGALAILMLVGLLILQKVPDLHKKAAD